MNFPADAEVINGDHIRQKLQQWTTGEAPFKIQLQGLVYNGTVEDFVHEFWNKVRSQGSAQYSAYTAAQFIVVGHVLDQDASDELLKVLVDSVNELHLFKIPNTLNNIRKRWAHDIKAFSRLINKEDLREKIMLEHIPAFVLTTLLCHPKPEELNIDTLKNLVVGNPRYEVNHLGVKTFLGMFVQAPMQAAAQATTLSALSVQDLLGFFEERVDLGGLAASNEPTSTESQRNYEEHAMAGLRRDTEVQPTTDQTRETVQLVLDNLVSTVEMRASREHHAEAEADFQAFGDQIDLDRLKMERLKALAQQRYQDVKTRLKRTGEMVRDFTKALDASRLKGSPWPVYNAIEEYLDHIRAKAEDSLMEMESVIELQSQLEVVQLLFENVAEQLPQLIHSATIVSKFLKTEDTEAYELNLGILAASGRRLNGIEDVDDIKMECVGAPVYFFMQLLSFKEYATRRSVDDSFVGRYAILLKLIDQLNSCKGVETEGLSKSRLLEGLVRHSNAYGFGDEEEQYLKLFECHCPAVHPLVRSDAFKAIARGNGNEGAWEELRPLIDEATVALEKRCGVEENEEEEEEESSEEESEEEEEEEEEEESDEEFDT